MNNHRETTTGTRAHSGGEMGWGARRTWWVRKQEGKIHQGKGTNLGAAGLLEWGPRGGNTGSWTGTERATALPSGESLLHSPGGHGTGGKYRTKRHTIQQVVHQTTIPGTKKTPRLGNSPSPVWGPGIVKIGFCVCFSQHPHTHPHPKGWTFPLHPHSVSG